MAGSTNYHASFGWPQQVLSRINSQDTAPLAYANQRCVAWRMPDMPQVDTGRVDVQYTLGTAAVTVTYSEVGIAVGKLVPVGAPTLTIIGWASIASDAIVGNGNFTKTLTLVRPPAKGEQLWFVTSSDAATPLTWRVANGADGLGGLVYRDATRISTNLNTPLTFTLNSAVVSLGPKADVILNP